jgi:hypothetical protein
VITLLKKSCLVFSFCVCSINLVTIAQDYDNLEHWAENIAAEYAQETEQEDIALLIEDLLSLTKHPLNINNASREDLERIFFLTDLEIENILYKRYINGPFLTIYELQAVEGLDVKTIKLLQPLIRFGPVETSPGKIRIWGDAFLRSMYQLEKAEGFRKNSEGIRPFAGDPVKLYNRIEITTNRGLSAGLIAEKDPGEPMFANEIKTFDLLTGYLHYQNKKGWIKEAGVGNYQISAAQGLVVQSGMPQRKSSMTTSIRNRRSPFRPSLSASEYSGMNGGYFTIGFERFTFSPFFSLKKRDGRLAADSSCISSLREDGLHRTSAELEQRHNTTELAAGGRISYTGKWIDVEAGHLYYRLDKPLCPEVKPYNQFYFNGKENRNSWLSYVISQRRWLLFGEIAFDQFTHPAFYHGIIWGAAPGFSLVLGHRTIPVKYHAPLAAPMTESSSFAGESGLYSGIKWELPLRITISSYFDYYRFKWLKFNADAPSSGFDWMGVIEKDFDNDATLYIRYRHREKPTNIAYNSAENSVVDIKSDQIKGQFRQKLTGGWQFTTLLQWHFVNIDNNRETGNMLSQDIKWKNTKENFTATLRYALFNSSDYSARMYAYEPDVLYMFSVPAYSGRGSRYLLLINYKIMNNLHLWLRCARWKYDDRDETGTGYQLVRSDKKTTLTAQIRVKF